MSTVDDQIVAFLDKHPNGDRHVIASAVRERKISAAQATHYRARLADPKQRTATLRLLTADVEAGGLAAGQVSESQASVAAEAYPPDWAPEVMAREQRRREAESGEVGSRVAIEPGVKAGPGHRSRKRGRSRNTTLER